MHKLHAFERCYVHKLHAFERIVSFKKLMMKGEMSLLRTIIILVQYKI